ncbi:MAG TPA: substrate-binding domain-containing protein, partial [Aggregatilineales bacterium]|nr:substrate-binding domain-containing protein [Aggregatilineales bacterium]
PREALQMTDLLDTRHTDGVFILGDLKNDEAVLTDMVHHSQQAVVALCRGPSPASLYTINTDNAAGSRKLLDHLAERGHRSFAFLDGGWLGDMRERREAYLAYLSENDLEQRPEWMQPESNDPGGGYRAMSRLLELDRQPTAVFAADDLMALGAVKAVFDSGRRVPDDVSVVGFDDIEMAEYYCPSLTTIRQPIEEMNRQALSLMLDLINNPEAARAEIVIRIKPELVVRQSTGPVKSG